jgi:hypothetical protein
MQIKAAWHQFEVGQLFVRCAPQSLQEINRAHQDASIEELDRHPPCRRVVMR